MKVELSIICTDTRHPTSEPTQSPTFSPTKAPTTAPTETCASLVVTGPQFSTGVYNKAVDEINGMEWWQSRNDVDNGSAKLYYYVGMQGRRWRLEGTTYSNLTLGLAFSKQITY